MRHPGRQRRLWASLAESGPQTPIVVVAEQEAEQEKEGADRLERPFHFIEHNFLAGRTWAVDTRLGRAVAIKATHERCSVYWRANACRR